MPPRKRAKLIASPTAAGTEEGDLPAVDQLSDDTIAMIFGYIKVVEIMHLRQVCKKWKEAAKNAVAARDSRFCVNSVNKYRAMVVMTRALPNIQEIVLMDLNYGTRQGSKDRYADGEDPDDEEVDEEATDVTTHDINVVSSFRKLRTLSIWSTHLNGRYPALFDFPKLQQLKISCCKRIKFDLEMLVGLPSLKEIDFHSVNGLTGNIESLRVLKDNIKRVDIIRCPKVTGNFMHLADFPRLECLNLLGTAVTGNIWDIGTKDFLKLEYLRLPHTVIGGG